MARPGTESWAERLIWSHLRRLTILVIICGGESIGLRVLRLANPRLRLVKKLFVMYPANEHYAKKIVYPFWMRRYRSRLAPCMLFLHDGAIGIVLGTTIPEAELKRDPNLVARVKRLSDEAAGSLGIQEVTYSGILPTLMLRAGLVSEHSEAHTTARVVAAGIEHVRREHSLAQDVPVAILGGAGEIGSRVASTLRDSGRTVHVLDPKHGRVDLDEAWRDTALLLVNVAHRGALHCHLDQLWPGVVYVNEVYPEPRTSELKALAERGIPAWHVAGVKAWALPPFPGAYGGGIPCCAASQDHEATPIMRKL